MELFSVGSNSDSRPSFGPKLKKRCTLRWMTRMKPQSISIFMHAQAVRAEDDEKRMNFTVLCSSDPVNKPIRILWCLIAGTNGCRWPEVKFWEVESERPDALPVFFRKYTSIPVGMLPRYSIRYDSRTINCNGGLIPSPSVRRYFRSGKKKGHRINFQPISPKLASYIDPRSL